MLSTNQPVPTGLIDSWTKIQNLKTLEKNTLISLDACVSSEDIHTLFQTFKSNL